MFKRSLIIIKNKVNYLHHHNLHQNQIFKFNKLLSDRNYDEFESSLILNKNDITIQDQLHFINQINLEKNSEINLISFYLIYGVALTFVINPGFIIITTLFCFDALFNIKKLNNLNSYIKKL